MKVIWFQSLEIVHHYEDGRDKFDDQSPKFQGRTELVKDAITRGNVTLRIWNITAADKGHYKCHFDDGLYQEEAGIELFVSEYFPQDFPWMLDVNGIITVASAFEISFVICYLWVMQSCEGKELGKMGRSYGEGNKMKLEFNAPQLLCNSYP
uniref:Immunoglobulin V-set domain-containing protein n=1 Tax=Monodelphis domestica TaxID=13616 RepID=A0A5F8GGD6_MONDO